MVSFNSFYMMLVYCTFLLFFIITPMLMNFMMLCEMIWMGIFNMIMYFGIEVAALTYMMYGLLMLCLAAAESVIMLTLVLYKFMVFGTTSFKSVGLKEKNYAYNNYLV